MIIPNAVRDDQLDEIAQKRRDAGQDLRSALLLLEFEDDATRDRFKQRWEDATQVKTYGEAWSKGRMGEQYRPLGYEVPVISKGFIDNIGEMQQSLGELLLVHLPQYIGNKVGAAPLMGVPGELGERARFEVYGLEKKLITQLVKELTTPDANDIATMKQALSETRDLKEMQRLQRMLDSRWSEDHPLSAYLAETTKKEILWFLDKQDAINKLTESPAEMFSDLLQVGITIGTLGGAAGAQMAGKGFAMTPKLQKLLSALDLVDPAMLPQTIYRGARHVTRPESRLMQGPDVDATDPAMVSSAEKFGAGVDATPEYVLQPTQAAEGREFSAVRKSGQTGKEALGRISATRQAIFDYRDNMIKSMQRGDNPIDIEPAGKHATDLYNERQDRDEEGIAELFATWNANLETRISPEFSLESRLQEIINSRLKAGKVIDDDLREAARVLQRQLDQLVESDGSINTMSLESLKQLRTNFRKQYAKAFDRDEVSEIGAGSRSGAIYKELTDLLYDAVDDTTQRHADIPDGLSDDLRKANKIYADIIQLESTPGGQHLIKNAKKGRYTAIITGLINPQGLATDEIKNFYKLLGDDSQDVQAAVLNAIFTKSRGRGDTPSPKGLISEINDINKADPSRLSELFGGGEVGDKVAKELTELGEFWNATSPAGRHTTNSPTALAIDEMMATQTVDRMLGIMQSLKFQNTRTMAMQAIAISADWLGSKFRFSKTARQRLLFGLQLNKEQETTLDLMIIATQRRVAKPAEVASRIEKEDAKE